MRTEHKELFEQTKEKAVQYVTDLIKNQKIRFDCPHAITIKYYLEHNPEKFALSLANNLTFSFVGTDSFSGQDIELLSDCFCSDCGESIDYVFRDGLITAMQRDCFSVEPFSVEINVLSGNLILVDWVRPSGLDVLGHLDVSKDNINAVKGRVQRSQKYAQANILHVFVGNSSPSVYTKEGLIYIGEDGFGENDVNIPLMPDGKEVGYVCTDLRWVTAFDAQVYKQLAASKKIGVNEFPQNEPGIVNIQVKPGVYSCTHYYETIKANDREPYLFTKMEWVRPTD